MAWEDASAARVSEPGNSSSVGSPCGGEATRRDLAARREAVVFRSTPARGARVSARVIRLMIITAGTLLPPRLSLVGTSKAAGCGVERTARGTAGGHGGGDGVSASLVD
ncbi:hypothetical protein E2562_014820 [Oryza meyeriana var. granulata]|uniref:Uncharacterized protein n=1 Tax=Oryza meyeriana var. granulata TaxID=110450 RepID=A0A6G1BW84_9ORYZ|nr:hypothetical protein E2562_014820 [Oryza meyeriana var. granulata]